MATLPKQMPSKPKEQPRPEAHIAICVAVVELGFQIEGGQFAKAESESDLQYDGKKVKLKVVPVFEIDQQVSEGVDKGKNMQVSVSNFGVDLSSRDKNTRSLGFWYKGIVGKALEEGVEYDKDMVGKLFTLTLAEGKSGYVDAVNATQIPASMKKNIDFKPNRIQYFDGKAPEGFDGVEEYKPHEALQNRIDSALPPAKLIEANKNNAPMVEWLKAVELAG